MARDMNDIVHRKAPHDEGRLASQLVSLTMLPSRWIDASAEQIVSDVADSLHRLCPGLDSVTVRLPAGPERTVATRRPEATAPPTAPDRGSPCDERQVTIPVGVQGEIVLTARTGEDMVRARLLATICANQIEWSSRTLDLEAHVARAHERVAVLGKLGALGQLVAGVAHEVRTPLTYATNNLAVLRLELDRRQDGSDHAAEPYILEVENALDRIAAIVGQLRKFMKSEVTTSLEEDLSGPVREALRLWRATHPGGSCVNECFHPTPPVLVDRGQLQQVVLNLVENAAEATGPTGRVTVRTHEEPRHAVITVEDNGPGMAAEVRANLFQPLHTTKRDGLGLGLSIVRGIVEAHRGSLRVESDPGQGTRVEVRIPRAAEDETPPT